jgi:enoyl-CoA hydratase/carnithine racemase
MTKSTELLLIDRHPGYAVLTLNRPEKRNALSIELLERLWAVLEQLRSERAIVLTGAGDIAFCAGADIGESLAKLQGGGRDYAGSFSGILYRILESIPTHPAVFIAAVNGFALGGGMALTNACELAVASTRAQFGLPQVGLGAFPGAGAPLIQRVLPKRAAWLILTAHRIDAATARAWGIVNEVVRPAELLPRSEVLAQAIAEAPREWVGAAKRSFWRDHGRVGEEVAST